MKFMIPISLLLASKYSYSDTKLPYDQFFDNTEIANDVLFLYDNSISFPYVEIFDRYDDDKDILRWQVEKYKTGVKPGELDDFFVKNIRARLTNIAGQLVKSFFSNNTFLSNELYHQQRFERIF